MQSAATGGESQSAQVETLLATPHLADALNSEQFRRFLDQVPIAILISDMRREERIIYANPRFERATGQIATTVVGSPWEVLSGLGERNGSTRRLGVAIVESVDFVGTFRLERPGDKPA